jgi:hypothetical protein
LAIKVLEWSLTVKHWESPNTCMINDHEVIRVYENLLPYITMIFCTCTNYKKWIGANSFGRMIARMISLGQGAGGGCTLKVFQTVCQKI